MQLSHLLLACLFTSIQCAPLPPPSSSLLRGLNLTADELGATVFALLYGSPLLQFYQLANGTLAGEGTNVLGSDNSTATASTHNVVRPNVDTVYAAGTFDLSATDVVLTVPLMEKDRFYLFAFYDPFGDNFASLGSVPASAAGKYLLRSTNSSTCVGYAGCITSPTTIGTMLARVEVKNNTTDVAKIDAYLAASTVVAVNPHPRTHPALTPADFAHLSRTSTALAALQLTARLESRSPPQTPLFRAAVPAILALAGISNGTYTPPPPVNLTHASTLANATLTAFTNLPSSYTDLGNGWSTLNATYSGAFHSGTAIVPRAIVAPSLYLQNTPDNSIYPTLGSTGQLSLSSSGEEAYIFTFSGGKPPVAADGFWSLTMYDDAGYLVENKQNTYAVGDRSNITYPGGELVYGGSGDGNGATGSGNGNGGGSGNGNGGGDGAFQVLVQDADVSPPGNWTANWLPAPSGGGSFTVTFRLYAPTAAAENGSYVYPVVTKGNAITA